MAKRAKKSRTRRGKNEMRDRLENLLNTRRVRSWERLSRALGVSAETTRRWRVGETVPRRGALMRFELVERLMLAGFYAYELEGKSIPQLVALVDELEPVEAEAG